MKKYILAYLILMNHWLIGQETSRISTDSLAVRNLLLNGDSLIKIARYEEALNQFMQAKDIYKKLSTPEYIKCITKAIECNVRMSKIDAIEPLAELITLNDSLYKTPIRELISFHIALGTADYIKGDLEGALEYTHKALALNDRISTEDHSFYITLYNNLGVLYKVKNEMTKAVDYYQRAIDLITAKRPNNTSDLAVIYGNLGSLYSEAGDFEQAQKTFIKAQELTLSVFGKNTVQMARLLTNLGNLQMLTSQYKDAENSHEEALRTFELIFGQEHFLPSRAFNNLGRTYNAQGKLAVAEQHYLAALNIRKNLLGPKHPDVALVYLNLADNALQAKKFDKALNFYQRSIISNVPSFYDSTLSENPEIGFFLRKTDFIRMLIGKAICFQNKFHFDDQLYNLSHALKTLHSTDTVIQKIRNSHLNQRDKIELGVQASEVYELAIKICLLLYDKTKDDHYKDLSFYFTEQNKSSVLTDALFYRKTKSFLSIPETVVSLEKNIKINKSYFRTKIQNAEIAKNGYDTAQYLSWKEKLFNLNRKLDSLTESFQQNFPKYYDLKYSNQTIKVEEVQEKLDTNEAFLEYFVGDSSSYVFSVTKDSFNIIPLDLDSLASTGITQFRQTLQSSLTASNSTSRFINQSRSLYKKYLSKVVRGLPDHINKLTIVGDGALSYIPFDILLTEEVTETSPSYEDLPYLLRKFQISFGHSAKLLFQQSSEKAPNDNKNFIAFAPSYSGDTDSLRSLKYGEFRDQVTSLKWNTPEIQGINEYMNGTLFTGKEAVEKAFKASVDQYNIVHLAMHALIDDEKPMNSKLIFSQVQDSTEDNFLHAYELYNMQLPAQMVVLSACETGFGKLEKGEGVMSLARAFAYAGCPSVVMSHWAVNDATTAKLMTNFYKYLSDGYSKDGALRQAKLDFLSEAGPAQANPLFWGSFVVMGDSDPINNRHSGSMMYILSALILLLSLVYMRMRNRSSGNKKQN